MVGDCFERAARAISVLQGLSQASDQLEAVLKPDVCRFSGSFEPIFDSKLWGPYRHEVYCPHKVGSKIGQNNPKKRRHVVLVQLLRRGKELSQRFRSGESPLFTEEFFKYDQNQYIYSGLSARQ